MNKKIVYFMIVKNKKTEKTWQEEMTEGQKFSKPSCDSEAKKIYQET